MESDKVWGRFSALVWQEPAILGYQPQLACKDLLRYEPGSRLQSLICFTGSSVGTILVLRHPRYFLSNTPVLSNSPEFKFAGQQCIWEEIDSYDFAYILFMYLFIYLFIWSIDTTREEKDEL